MMMTACSSHATSPRLVGPGASLPKPQILPPLTASVLFHPVHPVHLAGLACATPCPILHSGPDTWPFAGDTVLAMHCAALPSDCCCPFEPLALSSPIHLLALFIPPPSRIALPDLPRICSFPILATRPWHPRSHATSGHPKPSSIMPTLPTLLPQASHSAALPCLALDHMPATHLEAETHPDPLDRSQL